jgi:hypothetical protein
MIKLLQKYNYYPPDIKEYNSDRIEIKLINNKNYYLLIDNKQMMSYDIQTHDGAYQVFSHYDMAYGHVVVSGMGFGSRENWILTNPNVTKLSIIENCEELIEFHKNIQSPFINDPRVEIIKMNASDYNGKCDVLLLDHYEFEEYEDILMDVKKIHDQSDCKVLWFWPFERIIMHSRKWHTINDKKNVDKIGIGDINKMITKYHAFLLIKEGWGLDKIPSLDEQTINMYCMMFNSYLFSNSEFLFNTYLSDEKYKELYKYL